MIESIVDIPHQEARIVEQLRCSPRPVALYGAGKIAHLLFEQLTQAGVTVTTVFVDPQYASGVFHGLPVLTLDAVCRVHSRLDVVIANGDYKNSAAMLATIPAVENVFEFDNIYRLPEITHEFVSLNQDGFALLMDRLADEKSRRTLCAFLNTRISGTPAYLRDWVDPHQYFADGIVQLGEDEVFVDCGAYDGDTIAAFVAATGSRYHSVVALEPDGTNYERLCRQIQQRGWHHVSPIKKGAWNRQDTLRFAGQAENGSMLWGTPTTTVEVDALDNLLTGERVSFIKMDVEGAEAEALKGAAASIARWRPKLAISAYHKPDDLLILPNLISAMRPDYRFYLRAHKYISVDLVLYCV